MNQQTQVYIDGACLGNPGKGGWGVYINKSDIESIHYGGESNTTTNNRMELTAAIQALKICSLDETLVINSDSMYVVNGITTWIHKWKSKDWRGVKNPDLWKELDLACQGRDITWRWVKGHAGIEGNEIADALANLGIEELPTK